VEKKNRTENTIKRINERKRWFLEKTILMIANLTRKRKEKTEINKIRYVKEGITTLPKNSRRSLGNTLRLICK
jgi:hypothetical protein